MHANTTMLQCTHYIHPPPTPTPLLPPEETLVASLFTSRVVQHPPVSWDQLTGQDTQLHKCQERAPLCSNYQACWDALWPSDTVWPVVDWWEWQSWPRVTFWCSLLTTSCLGTHHDLIYETQSWESCKLQSNCCAGWLVNECLMTVSCL